MLSAAAHRFFLVITITDNDETMHSAVRGPSFTERYSELPSTGLVCQLLG